MKVKAYAKPTLVLAIIASVYFGLAIMRSGASALLNMAARFLFRESRYLRLADSYGRLPLTFEANRGEVDSRVRFVVHGNRSTSFLTQDSLCLGLDHGNSNERENSADPSSLFTQISAKDNVRVKPHWLCLKLEGANPDAKVEGLDKLAGKSNYFIGRDPEEWRTNIPNYAKVKYSNVYGGVDLLYHGNQQRLEYDFLVRPGGDPRQIKLVVQPPKSGSVFKVSTDRNGKLLIRGGRDEVTFDKPRIYQPATINHMVTKNQPGTVTSGHFIDGKYILKDNCVTFEVASYDKSRPLVIDPTLIYSTFVGGAHGYGIAVDGSGNTYLTGITGGDLPFTAGAFSNRYTDPTYTDVFVTKLNAEGSALIYSTYLGGSANDEGEAIAVDSSGNAYVTGWTGSADFPTTRGAFQTSMKGGYDDAFVSKLNVTGSALLYSTYLGGSSYDEGRGIAVDRAGDAYVAGLSYSANFPTSLGSVQTTLAGYDDAFVTELNASGSAPVYSPFLGGSSYDEASGIAIDASGDAYVVGSSYSANFPTTAGAFRTTPGGGYDVFVSKLKPGGSALIYSSYIGGVNDEFGYGIAIDSSNSVYLTGRTYSPNFPTTANVLQPHLGGGGGHGDAFVTKLNAAGSALVYSTYLGGSGDEVGYALAVDRTGNAFVTGATYSFDFPTTPGAPENTPEGFDDGFVSKLNPAGSGLVYSTYLGGNKVDEGHGITVDSTGNAFITGWTTSTNFPVTVGAFQTLFGRYDAFVTKISAE